MNTANAMDTATSSEWLEGGEPTSTFERTVQRFKDSLTPGEVRKFSVTTLQSLQSAIAGIQESQSRRKTMQNLKRIAGFLEVMELYSKVLNVFVNASELVAFIWGPIRLLLLTTKGAWDAFDALLDMYQQLGERLPMLEQYDRQWSHNPRVKRFLELVFEDIFEFHRKALHYFRRGGVKIMLGAFWNKFNAEFQTILSQIEQHRQGLFEQASLEHFSAVQQEAAMAAIRQAVDHQRHRLEKLDSWLSAADAGADQEELDAVREKHPESCQWILGKEAYVSWRTSTTTANRLLWMHGIPGAGKSVLSSFVAEDIRRTSDSTVLTFNCRHDDPKRNNFVAMARSLLWQLVQIPKNELVVENLYQYAIKGNEQRHLRTQKLARKLLNEAAEAAGKLTLVIDGLDECVPSEQEHITSWVRIFNELHALKASPFRCLILSQYDGSTSNLLKKWSILPMMPTDNQSDIQRYCEKRSEGLRSRFCLQLEVSRRIASDIAREADGMFLFAKLVLEHLQGQLSSHNFWAERQHIFEGRVNISSSEWDDSNPIQEKLDNVYHRILRRIVDDADKPKRDAAHQLLKWVFSALRPLAWREVQAALSIDVEAGVSDMSRRWLVDSPMNVCGSLVVLTARGQIHFVHHTLKKYLARSRYISPCSEHLALAELCISAFCFEAFAPSQADFELDNHIMNGEYGFLDYASMHWARHLELGLQIDDTKAASHTPSPERLLDLAESLQVFLDIHYREAPERCHQTQTMKSAVKVLQNELIRKRVLHCMASMFKLTYQEVPEVDKSITLYLIPLLFRIRRRLEMLASNDQNLPTLQFFYGHGLYKCARLYCKWSYEGWNNVREQQKHRIKHERPHHCPHTSCISSIIGFETQKLLDTHLETYHPKDDEYPDMSNATGPKKAKKESYPQNSEAKHDCKLCGKMFTRTYNLRNHMRSHNGEKPHACSTCGKAFARSSDCKRHEDRMHANTGTGQGQAAQHSDDQG